MRLRNLLAIAILTLCLVAAGASPARAFQSGGGINPPTKQVFTNSGTYTPTPGTKYAMVELVGGGGGGGGVAGAPGYGSGAGGGAGGAYARCYLTAAQIGASQTVTIGGGGAQGTGTPTAGGSGGDTSFGSLCAAHGGGGGGGASSGVAASGGVGSTATIGDVLVTGNGGDPGVAAQSLVVNAIGGGGGGSFFGPKVGGRSYTTALCANGGNAPGYGAGGQGAGCYNNAAGALGGFGSGGIVVVTEYH